MGQAGKTLSIGEAARRLGIPVSTLRDWADANRVPVLRTPTGYRRFDPDDIERLRRQMAGESDPEEEGPE